MKQFARLGRTWEHTIKVDLTKIGRENVNSIYLPKDKAGV
jgi:hypothetical protein